MNFENAGSTIMSILFGVSQEDTHTQKEYLERFARQYTQPLVDFLCKAKKQTEEDAFDLVQSFWVEKLVQPPPQENIVAKFLVAKERGSFRKYLMRAVSNYFLDWLRRKKRLHALSLEQLEGFDAISEEDVNTFDFAWANRLLRTVVNNVHDECMQNNQQDMWKLFLQQLILPRLMNCPPPGYAALALEMGFRDARSASNAVRTVIRKFQSHMKHCIGDYVPASSMAESNAGISQEFDEIISVLSKQGALDLAIFSDLLPAELLSEMESKREASHLSVEDTVQEISFINTPEKSLYATNEDIAFRWSQLRASSILGWLSPHGVKLDPKWDASFDSLARGEFLPEDMISKIRNNAKQSAREPKDEPVVILALIYLLAIAAGYEHHHRIFSSDSSQKIKNRMLQLLELSWLDKNSRRTLQRFLDSCSG